MLSYNKRTSIFLKKFIGTIEEFKLIEWGESVLIAVSGGVDSVSLLYSLYFLRHLLGIKISCAVFDHGIRESSYKEVEYLENLCNILSVPFYTDKANIVAESKINKKSIEETARNFRYKFLYKTANEINADKIAAAHHLDDFAENFLMRTITGGGSGSIAGIKVKNGMIIRPFIKFSKKEIIDFAKLNSIKFFEDYTNYQEDIFRNNIRLNIIPIFKKINPSFLNTIYRTSEVLRQDDEFIENCAREIFKNNVSDTEYKNSGMLTFNIHDLLKMPETVLYRFFKLALYEIIINKNDNKDNNNGIENFISYGNFKNFLNIIKSSKPNILFNLNKNIRIIKTYEKIIFEKIENDIYVGKIKNTYHNFPLDFKHYEYLINHDDIVENNLVNINTINKFIIHIKELDLNLIIGKYNDIKTKTVIDKLIKKNFKNRLNNTILFDFDKLSFPIKIRNFMNGDRFTPLGMQNEKKVKNFFIDKKIPVLLRHNVPIILSDNKIAWIGFIIMSDMIKITDSTKSIGYMKLLNNNK
ncbi:MAG: tRNA lysidine(34) synthetase TilS [Deltaproteobacteria bacterium]|nr:tRNA lysidine(34) synthetase TilS [Deltaproteobacteria bacterium]